ncbi:hypothetical protein Hypma_006444 [Hypsizygus marmoreus]|uniref:F-box domain-containing protein n=1 Tax=Hypsizygus marmoreus TaxID=39966 RepID=A0A369JVC2_HYPMA|nr:hypothetical protein Hypma_006444 [Hypsizygus marmoreus]
MFSDEDVSEDFPPELVLYSKKANELSAQGRGQMAEKCLELHGVWSFLRTVEGFHTGSLDLSGRHHPRFSQVETQWDAYLVDFLGLSMHATGNVVESSKHRPPCFGYSLADDTLWQKFRERWMIPSYCCFNCLWSNTDRVLQTLARLPVPRIQQICLLHLPFELLDNVFRLAALKEARLLASVCRELNHIAQRYIFRRQRFIFKEPWNFLHDFKDGVDIFPHMLSHARLAREALLAGMAFLLDRPDLAERVHHLSLSEQWFTSIPEIEPRFFTDWIAEEEIDPIYDAFANLVYACPHITSLFFKRITITLEIIQAISNLHHLHTLELSNCLLSTAVYQLLDSEDPISMATSVHNLHSEMSVGRTDQWYMPILCPHLRTLCVRSLKGRDLFIPHPMLYSKFTFFNTLQRLFLSEIHHEDFQDLVTWFTSIASTITSLSHFKLHAISGIADSQIISLLGALRMSPLQVLVLEGLAEAEFPLFDYIAQHFPHVLGLTLVRRASNRQKRDKAVRWPHRPWEYARWTARLTNLQHFGWNAVDDRDCPSLVSSALLQFEDGFLDEDKDVDALWDAECLDYSAPDVWTPVIFAIHCPTIKTFASMTSSSFSQRRIIRAADGSISVEVDRNGFECWNPTRHAGSWPTVLPTTT